MDHRRIGSAATALLLVALSPVLAPIPSRPATAADPAASPTAPPDLFEGWRAICERLPDPNRDACLLGIVEQAGVLIDPEAREAICALIQDQMDRGVCTAIGRADPDACRAIEGDDAPLLRELCIGRAAEALCREVAPADRDACLVDIATRHEGPFACASVRVRDLRLRCEALAAHDPAACDRIPDPVLARDCRRAVRALVRDDSASPVASPAPATVGDASGWSGALADHPDSRLRFTLDADGTLAGSGTVPRADGDTVVLEVVASTVGDGPWSGEMTVELRSADGSVSMDALGGLEFSDRVTWRAERSGDGLVGDIDTYGSFRLEP